MARGLRINMYNPEVLLLVTCVALSTAIRVDFGTNTGPIVPATPTTTKQPQPPFRNPAPVWEDQSGDIPNPKPYKYVPPPPSRPKYNQQKPREFNFDRVLPTQDVNKLYTSTVSNRGPQVFPNFGYNYNSVVPTTKYYTKNLDVYYTDKFNKFNGKYNIKTKKYKVYEKVKYVPQVYYSQFIQVPTISLQQQLPLMQTPQPFRMPGNIPIVHTSPATLTISTPKTTHTKDAPNSISKNYRTHQTYESQQNTLSHDSKTKRS